MEQTCLRAESIHMSPDSSPSDLFAPVGLLRAAINLGNPILAGLDPATGRPSGVSVDLAQAFADRIGTPLELLTFDTAAAAVKAVTDEAADIGFFAIDPERGAGISFTGPYLLIEGCYLVRGGSPLRASEDVDRAGMRVVVGRGSAYDLHLTRQLRHARIERAPSSPEVVDTFLALGADVAAGVRAQLESDARRMPELRLLDGHFMLIRQAMGTSKARGPRAGSILSAFVEEMKANGFIADSLVRHQVDGATMAPLQAASAAGPAAPHAG
jgi:polar amino acid transport system substrate-binding protein